MTNLSETQKEVLITASQRADGNIYPLPSRLKGASINKVLNALYNKGFITKQEDKIVITDTGEEAICDNQDCTKCDKSNLQEEQAEASPEQVSEEETSDGDKTPKAVRKGTKKAILLDMLAEGSTIEQIEEATNWQKHTIRGTMSNLKKQQGFNIASIKSSDGYRIYKIA